MIRPGPGRTLTVCGVICLLLAFAISLDARPQSSTRGRSIRILAAGGFLGQLDGMPEYPAGPFDTGVGPDIHPYGGLEGLIRWRSKRPRHDLVLVTANNLPRNVMRKREASVEQFFARLYDLEPSAIAVGVEDFLRGLDNKGTPALFVDWLREPPTRSVATPLPFVLSNAGIRRHRPGFNTTLSGGFALGITPDASIGWVKRLSMTVPCDRRKAFGETGKVTLTGPGAPAGAAVPAKVGENGCAATLTLPIVLRPGSQYALAVQVDGASVATFDIHTDETLTRQAAIVPAREELPIIVSLVDPLIRKIMNDDRWRWSETNGAECPRKFTKCAEIVVYPPADALEAVLGFSEPAGSQRPVALLSQLTDKDTSSILQRSARVRVVVLPPDSQSLGRVAPRTTGGRDGAPYSGDLGYGAVLNGDTPEVTQIWVRPEWFAEAAHEITADVTVSERGKQKVWEIDEARQEAHSVPGLALCARPPSPEEMAKGLAVNYFLQDWTLKDGATVYIDDPNARLAASSPELYAMIDAGTAYDAAGKFKQGAMSLWRDRDTFAAVALDAMRRDFNTDLALLPHDAIDENWFTYLEKDLHAPPQASKILLERLLFRAGTIVTVRIAGGAIADTIGRIVRAGEAANVSTCLTGLGISGCVSRIDPKDLLINGRRIDQNRYYTIALAENVALANDLKPYGKRSSDLAAIMDLALARNAGPSVNTCAAGYLREKVTAPSRPPAEDQLPALLESLRANENNPYLIVKPVELQFSESQVKEPAAGKGLLGKLSVPGNGVRPSRRIVVNVTVDAGLIDRPRWSLRATTTLAYGRARINNQTSTDPNNWLAGIRIDRKVSRGRIFGGLFWESQFDDQASDVTASTKGGPTLELVTLRRDFRYLGAGFELERPQFRKWLSFDALRVTFAGGESFHEHTDVAINGERQGLPAFIQLGAAQLLGRYVTTHPGVTATTYAFIDERLTRARVQIDATPHVKLTFGGRPFEIVFAGTYRQFFGSTATPLSEKRSAVMKLTFVVPVYGLATLNLNATGVMSQVNNVDGWFRIWQPSVSVSIPLVGSRRAGWVH